MTTRHQEVHEVPELVEERRDLRVQHQRGVAVLRLGEVADETALGQELAVETDDEVDHHRVLVLVLAREHVQVEATDDLALLEQVVGHDVRVPRVRILHDLERDAVQLGRQFEQSLQRGVVREVRARLLAVEFEALLANALDQVDPFVQFDRIGRGVGLALLLEQVRVLLGAAHRREVADLIDELRDPATGLGHLVLGDVVRPRVVSQELRQFAAARQEAAQRIEVLRVRARHGLHVESLPYVHVVRVHHDRQRIGRIGRDGHGAVLAFGMRGQEVGRQSAEHGVPALEHDRLRTLCDRPVERLPQLDHPVLQGSHAIARRFVAIDTRATEVPQSVLEAPARRRIGVRRQLQLGQALEHLTVQRHLGREGGGLLLARLGQLAHVGVRMHRRHHTRGMQDLHQRQTDPIEGTHDVAGRRIGVERNERIAAPLRLGEGSGNLMQTIDVKAHGRSEKNSVRRLAWARAGNGIDGQRTSAGACRDASRRTRRGVDAARGSRGCRRRAAP